MHSNGGWLMVELAGWLAACKFIVAGWLTFALAHAHTLQAAIKLVD
jgi:hypothetical protein